MFLNNYGSAAIRFKKSVDYYYDYYDYYTDFTFIAFFYFTLLYFSETLFGLKGSISESSMVYGVFVRGLSACLF